MSNSPIIIKITHDQAAVVATLPAIGGVQVQKSQVRFVPCEGPEGRTSAVEALRMFLVTVAAAKASSDRPVAAASVLRKAHAALDAWESVHGDSLAAVEAAQAEPVDEDDRDVQAFRMRDGGAPFRVIAEALGFAAPASARGAAIRGAAKVGGEVAPAKVKRAAKVLDGEPVVFVPEVFEPASLVGIAQGQEVTISSRGESNPGGRFRFDRFSSDGSLTCWGPVNDARQSWRNFRPERVKQVHVKVKDVAAAKAAEVAA